MTRGFIAADALGLPKTYALKDMAQAHRDLESSKRTESTVSPVQRPGCTNAHPRLRRAS